MPSTSRPPVVSIADRFPALVAFFLSGASSLIFQNIWSRDLHHVFGATSEAISTVVSLFMAGLGLGAWLAGRYADRIKHPIISYALAELCVGAWALVVPLLLQSEGWLASYNAFLHRSDLADSAAVLSLGRFIAVVPVLLVPTTLMGTTLPLLARHFVRAGDESHGAAAKVGTLYSINTLGAVAGIVLAGFVLMPWIGVSASNYVALSINFGLGAGILVFRRLLLGDQWSPGERLEWWPAKTKADVASAPPPPDASSRSVAGDESTLSVVHRLRVSAGIAAVLLVLAVTIALVGTTFALVLSSVGAFAALVFAARAWAAWRGLPRETAAEALIAYRGREAAPADDTLAIPKVARTAAFVTFGASGAAALCYEVVWTRALAMTIGSSIYSFALILVTFLVGIAGGSALCAAMLDRTRKRVSTAAMLAIALLAIALVPCAVGSGVDAFLAAYAVLASIVGVVWFVVRGRSLPSAVFAMESQVELPAKLFVALPILVAAINVVVFDGVMPILCFAVVVGISAYLFVFLGFRRAPVLLIACVQFLIAANTLVNYLALDEVPYAFAQLVTTLDDLPDHVGTVQFFMFLTAGLCTLPAAVGMGAMFPLTIRVWSAGGDEIGRDVGSVYSVNTLGSILGAWLPGFVLMPWIGMEAVLVGGIVLNLLLALVMVIAGAADDERGGEADVASDDEERPRGAPLSHAIAIYVLSPLIPAIIAVLLVAMTTNGLAGGRFDLRWNRAQMTLGVFRVSLAADVLNPEAWGEPEVVFYADGRSTTVSVERWGRHLAMKNNGKVDASNGDDMPTQIMVSGLPILMHSRGPDELDVAVIGFGSGVSVGAALQFPVRGVDVIELEQNIPRASQYFADVNHLDYPGCDDADDSTRCEWPFAQADRLQVINNDGRNYLASTDASYDVIVSEPSNPWITGVSDLFTTDHFEITKRRLRPGGIYCQWVQLYELSPRNIKTIYRTFASQFEHVVVFSAEDLSSDTIMIGSDSPLPLSVDRVAASFDDPRIAAELERAYVHSPYDVFARVILATREEVLQYTQIESRLRGDRWRVDPQSSNDSDCPPATCRRMGAALNTDDNALIEFSAPRDLIGFEAYEGYLSTIYSPEWPYGRLMGLLEGFGDGDDAAKAYAEMAMALVAHGRKAEAGDFIRASADAGQVRETLVAAEVLRLLLTDENEPSITIEPPVPGPEMDDRTARELLDGFESVRTSVDAEAYGAALAAMEQIPAPIRLHSGPSLRLLYAYLLYKVGDEAPHRYQSAIEEFEDLIRGDEAYARRHPELYYFLARAHDAELNYDKALRNMRVYVESRLVTPDAVDLPEPPLEEAPTTDVPGVSPKERHSDRT